MPNTPTLVAPTAPSFDAPALPRTFAGRALAAIGATAFVALCAHVSVPLFFTPVPVTLQTFAVLVIGLLFGPSLAASTLLLYLAEGAAGLPVFNPQGPGGVAQLLGPTGGFLLACPLAAAVTGWIARTRSTRTSTFSTMILASLAGIVVVFAIGAPWTAHWLHLSVTAAWQAAVLPFLPGEGLKVGAAAIASTAYSRWRHQ
ncbi:MAG TPA: biotin transporter BioY [Acidobacteriaceae bacterium]